MNQKTDFGLRMLNISDVATVLGVSIFTIRAMVEAGRFPEPVIVNKSRRWAVETVRKFATGEWRPAAPALPEEAA